MDHKALVLLVLMVIMAILGTVTAGIFRRPYYGLNSSSYCFQGIKNVSFKADTEAMEAMVVTVDTVCRQLSCILKLKLTLTYHSKFLHTFSRWLLLNE